MQTTENNQQQQQQAPAAVARTSTLALTNASLPFILEIANKGYVTSMQENLHLKNGLNVYRGNISHVAVAAALGYPLSTI